MSPTGSSASLEPFVPGQIWLCAYPVRYAGCAFTARMTVLALGDGRLALHSPGPIDRATKADIDALGRVTCLIAPGTYHWQHVASAQAAYPDAETFLCPGIERKRPRLRFDWLLSDRAPAAWDG